MPAGPKPGTRRSMVGGLALVAVTIAGAQLLEWAINRFLRPDAEEWTWISDVVLSAGLLVMAVVWARLKQARIAVSALEAQRIVLDAQLGIAAEVQRALLPAIPAPVNDVHWYGSIEPAGRVGGDYFDFLALPDGRMIVILADISGKGIPAAIFVSNIRAIIHALVRDVATPGELLDRLSRDVLADARAGLYATCFVALVDSRRRTMTYSNAGHPPGVLAGPRRHRALSVGGPPVGLIEGAAYASETLVFGEGDVITLVSDGISEALDVAVDLLPAAIAEAVSDARPRTPEAVCRHLIEVTHGSHGPREIEGWADDRTVVAFGIVAPPNATGSTQSFNSTP